jgi:hypothetical protein
MRKLRRHIKHRFSIAAPRLAVRPHLPWYLRWGLVLPFVLGAGWLIWWAYGSGLELAGFHREQAEDELTRLNRQVVELSAENTRLNSKLIDYERQIQMELATNTELDRQLKALNDEKANLNEDLAFYQNLTQSGSREESLTIQRLKVVHDTLPGEYHCSMLLVQGGQRPKDFRGNFQLVVNIRHNDEKSVLTLPQGNSPESQTYQLDFKYYQRIERSFQLPDGMVLESVQVRVYERGASEPRAKQDATLS